MKFKVEEEKKEEDKEWRKRRRAELRGNEDQIHS